MTRRRAVKVLVATTETQGAAPGDSCSVPEGEIVVLGTHAFDGIDTNGSTTTAKVVERSDLAGKLSQTELDRLQAMLQPLRPGTVVERQGRSLWPRRAAAA